MSVGNSGHWPKAIQFRNIRKDARVCCECGNEIRAKGSFYVYSPEPGKYLCFACERAMSSAKNAATEQEDSSPSLPTPYTVLEVQPYVPESSAEGNDRADAGDPENFPWSQYNEMAREAREIRRDMAVARAWVEDALLRYVKQKVRARSKKQAADMAGRFAVLNDYGSEDDIHDAFGWGSITENECNRLLELWRLREECVNQDGKYEDRVTEMVRRAMGHIGEEYLTFLELVNAMEQAEANRKQELERARLETAHKRYIAGLES